MNFTDFQELFFEAYGLVVFVAAGFLVVSALLLALLTIARGAIE